MRFVFQITFLNSNNAISIQISTETIFVNKESISKNEFLLPVPVKTEIKEPSDDVTIRVDDNVAVGDDSDVEVTNSFEKHILTSFKPSCDNACEKEL